MFNSVPWSSWGGGGKTPARERIEKMRPIKGFRTSLLNRDKIGPSMMSFSSWSLATAVAVMRAISAWLESMRKRSVKNAALILP